MGNNQKIIIAGIIAILVVAAGIGFWYWQRKKTVLTAPVAPSVTEEAGKSIGSTIFEKTQEPLKNKFPETNPLKRVIINPFK